MEDQENNNNNVRRSTMHERKHMYRELTHQLEDIEETNDFGLETINKTGDILRQLNMLSEACPIDEKVKCPDEVFLDMFAMSNASKVVLKCVKALDVKDASYEPLQFAKKIAEYIKTNEGVEELDFLKLLDDARNIIPNTIEYNFIYGAYDFTTLPSPKEKKQRITRETQKEAPKKVLTELKKTQQDDEDENNDNVVFLSKVLEEEYQRNKEQPLKYYDFVIDANSYCITIENMFYVSFLIRDGKAALLIDENNEPIIKPVSQRELKSFRRNNGANTQMVTSFTMDDWNRLKPKRGLIEKHRKKQ